MAAIAIAIQEMKVIGETFSLPYPAAQLAQFRLIFSKEHLLLGYWDSLEPQIIKHLLQQVGHHKHDKRSIYPFVDSVFSLIDLNVLCFGTTLNAHHDWKRENESRPVLTSVAFSVATPANDTPCDHTFSRNNIPPNTKTTQIQKK